MSINFIGQKRLRRQAKYLANFVLYTTQKKLDFNDKMDEISARSKLLEELKDKRMHIMESINNKALQKAKQLSLVKKVVFYKICTLIIKQYERIYILLFLFYTSLRMIYNMCS